MQLSAENAEILGLEALAWLAASEDLMPVFLNASGASESDLRQRAGEPEFLGAVLDFLMMDDEWVTGFCDSRGHAYDLVMRARMSLPGGAQTHWT